MPVQAPQIVTKLLSRLWQHLSQRRRRHFAFLLVLMILASLSEVLSIGAVMPFIAVITAPGRVFEHAAAQPFIGFLGLTSADQLLLPLAIAFGLAALIAGAVRLLVLWASTRLAFATGAEFSIDIYRRTLYQTYAVHLTRNSSEIIAGISVKTNSVIHVTMMSLNFVSASIILTVLLIAMLAVDPVIALAAIGGFGSIYGVIVWITRHRLLSNSQRIAHESTQVVKSLQEGLGGIRDILINGSQSVYCEIYRSAEFPSRRAQGSSAFIGASPRYAMEALGMILIAGLAYVLAQQSDGVARVIPVLGALALGAMRILPVLQLAYGAWSAIQGERAALRDILDLLDQPLPEHAGRSVISPLPFRQHISLAQVSFRYSADTPWILHNFNLTIPKGSRIGFIGVTGSGKSTLLDIIMGLLLPTSGILAIDGQAITPGNNRAWQTHIAHVPQAIFLADTTIEENIAFGQPISEIDHERVRSAARQAQIADIIETWPEQYQTFVGERGIRLSGGQRQRIGIARALYRNPSVIIFDEATSALDSETEQAVMQAIEGLSHNLTILIVAHRISTLKNCTLIVELGDKGILRTGTYQDIVSAAA
ncbi:MAG: ABC transporter ATP-binding protein [Betaproteobacteria bacterium RIFCSPLOWO2_02_FULL_62_17]|nr:MAG: ABC transporter ATP-binding protein [Betaproteobacteria bacterium RIFCSPLOWO2_02_FULL_62_17]